MQATWVSPGLGRSHMWEATKQYTTTTEPALEPTSHNKRNREGEFWRLANQNLRVGQQTQRLRGVAA